MIVLLAAHNDDVNRRLPGIAQPPRVPAAAPRVIPGYPSQVEDASASSDSS